jgi:16S rRNA (cytosine967-C5)-methyltransferase
MAELLPGAVAALAPDDRARAQRLALGTLRWADRADRLLGPYLRHRPEPRAHDALRLAIYEMFVEGAAPHGVVDAAVSLVAADPASARQAKLVNAVLRNVDRAGAAAWAALPPPQLPKRLRRALLAAHGKAAVAAMEAAHAAGAPLDLTAKADAAGWAARLGGRLTPTGSIRLPAGAQVTALPGYGEGAWWVQDAAAALPAGVLGAAPGEAVLDLCAAPGGKALQMAAAGAEVTALDISARRMARLEENLARCGLSARVVVADALEWQGGPFDAILLDAPCSATGTIRRHPDLPHAKAKQDFAPLFALQERLIDRAVAQLRPGGRLVYCTCSLLPEEGEVQAANALARHPALRPDRAALERPGVPEDWIDSTGLRSRPDHWPDIGGLDGFFIAAFRHG